jgi:hypothetical protein
MQEVDMVTKKFWALAAILAAMSLPGKSVSACDTVSSFAIVQAPDGAGVVASLGQTDVNSMNTPWETVTDPDWHVVNPTTGGHVDAERMNFISSNLHTTSNWGVKVHCERKGADTFIHCWFEVRGAADHNTDYLLYLRPPDRQVMEARLNLVPHYPASPTFCIEPFTGTP